MQEIYYIKTKNSVSGSSKAELNIYVCSRVRATKEAVEMARCAGLFRAVDRILSYKLSIIVGGL